MKDAYVLLNEAHALWQQNAMAKNDASSIKKHNEGIKLWCKTPYGLYEIQSVSYDSNYGIMMEVE